MKSFAIFYEESCGCKHKTKLKRKIEEALLTKRGKGIARSFAAGAAAAAIPLALSLAGHTQKEKPNIIGNRVVSQVSPAPKKEVVAKQEPAKPQGLGYTDLAHGVIKHFEGFREKAYQDELTKSKVPTIGWGMTKHSDGRPVKIGDTITREEGDKHLASHVEDMRARLAKTIPHWDAMEPHHHAAITSFAHNFGTGFYGKEGFETITGALRDKRWNDVPSALSLYKKSGGVERAGLVRRRGVEGEMWRGNVSGFNEKGEPTYKKK